MSINRRRRNKGATKRAYLKVVQGANGTRFDRNPDDLMKAAIGKGRDIHSTQPIVMRNGILYPVLNGKNGKLEWRWTPNMTEPMKERTESWHTHIKEHRTLYQQILLNTSTVKIRLFFDGFDSKTLYWFKEDNRLLGVVRESFTFSNKHVAMDHYHKGTIPWK